MHGGLFFCVSESLLPIDSDTSSESREALLLQFPLNAMQLLKSGQRSHFIELETL